MNCQILWTYGENADVWIIQYRDLYNYLREVLIHKSKILLSFGDKHVSDLTPEDWTIFRPWSFYKRDESSSSYATGKFINRYPLYPIGTRVKSMKTGRIGTITETYNHNGTAIADSHGDMPKNSDKYGVTFDSGRTKHAWFRVDEFYVENPLGPKWARLMGKVNRLINPTRSRTRGPS